MATAAIDEIDYFELSASAARRLKVSPATLIRFEAIRLQLAAHGVRRDDKRIPLWIAPIVCTTPEARRLFLEGFPEDPDDVRRPITDRERDPASEGKARPKPKDGRSIGWRGSMLGSALLLPIGALLLVPQLSPDPPAGNQLVEAPTTTSSRPNLNPTSSPAAKPADEGSVTTLLMLVLPSLLAIAYIIWLRRRRRSIRRHNAPEPERSVNLAFAAGLQNVLTDRTLRKALGNLRRHRPVASSKLNVPAAIRATIRSAGFPQMRYGFRPRSPDYLLLNERESPADHLTMIGRVMATRMTEEHVAHGRYEYFGDPRRLQLIERGATAGVFPLTTVLARHDGARVMLFQESHDCFAEETSPEWLARIAETERPVLLNPRSRDAWGAAETRLTALGLGIFSPSGGGIADYGDFLNATGNVRRRLTRSNAYRFDLPESLARDRDQMLDNEPPLDPLISELVISELVMDLDIWLDEGGSYWLRALALFPYIDPGFTVFLGTALVDDAGKPLMDEARFIDLARLPWLRAGRMPDWLRRALVRGLTPAQLEAATNAIQAFLMPAEQPEGATAIDFSRGEDRKLRKRLLDWLKLTPESVLSDQLLIEALKGCRPDQLGVEAPKALLHQSRSLWARNEARTVILAAIATAAIAMWQWPVTLSGDHVDAGNEASDGKTNTQEDAQEDNPVMRIVEPSQTPLPDESPSSSPSVPLPEPSVSLPALSQAEPTVEPSPGDRDTLVAGPFIIFFDWDKTDISPEAASILDVVAKAYFSAVSSNRKGEPQRVLVRIGGYADTERRPEYSVGLSQRMAESAGSYLASRGIPRSDIVTDAMSSSQSPDRTKQDFGELQNRRVEITITRVLPPPTAN